jgi:hypothetical protein
MLEQWTSPSPPFAEAAKEYSRDGYGTRHHSLDLSSDEISVDLRAPSSKVFVGGDDDSLQSVESATEASCGQEASSSVTLEGTTELYDLLEESEWDAAGQRCLSHPEEAEQWLTRWGDDGGDDLQWKLLPLHAAIIFQCPVPDLVVTLCHTYRDACREPDDQGMLPLHLAFRNLRIPTHDTTADAFANEDAVEERIICILLDAWPEAMFVKDYRNRIPLIHAGKDSCDTPTSRSLLQQTHPMVMNYYLQWEQTLTATKATETQPPNDDEWDGPLNSSFEIATHHPITEQRVITPEQNGGGNPQHTTRAQLEERVKVLQLETESQQREFEWEQRVEELEMALQKSQSENNLLHAVMEDMKVQQDTLILQLETLMEGQALLGKLVTCHKTEQFANDKVRDKLLRSLLEQEEEDRTATLRHQDQIMSLMDNLRDKTETVLKSVTTDLAMTTLEEEEVLDKFHDDIVGGNDDDSQQQHKTEPRLSDRQKMDDISCITDLSE